MGYALIFVRIHPAYQLSILGAFDIISEFLPHLAIILYRIYPDSHVFLCKLFRAACMATFVGTISETIVVMYLFGQLWFRWSISFKVATPLLHIAFSAAQLHGTHIFYRMWRKEQRILHEREHLEQKGMSGLESVKVT
jgi:hypothetical protein